MTRARSARPLLVFLFAAVCATSPGAAAACAGDCSGDLVVNVDELVTTTAVALGRLPAGACPRADVSGDNRVTVDEVVAAVNRARYGCTATPAPTPTPTPPAEDPPPTGAAELAAWLAAGSYRGWAAESRPHASVGPHFGTVRTFLNAPLIASLTTGAAAHPAGSAVVKELFGRSGDTVRGWSVMIKLDPDSAGGNGWYWYESFGGSIFAAGRGVGLCTGCHRSDYQGLTSRDFLLTPFPLQ
jgi:hypothetical protein